MIPERFGRCMLSSLRRWRRSRAVYHNRYHDNATSPFKNNNAPTPRWVVIKQGNRGGQNLSERYKRLERSLRGKVEWEGTLTGKGRSEKERTKEDKATAGIMFRGVEIPNEPKAPGSEECCMSGCAICVYDLYEEAIGRWKEEVEGVKGRLREMGVDESEWPLELGGRKRSVVTEAFEELERELAKKRGEKKVLKEEVANIKEALAWFFYSNS